MGSKLVLPRGLGGRGHKLEYKNKEETSKFFFSETGRHRALISSMKHLLVGLYQVSSSDAPGVKIGPAPGVTNWNIRTKKENFKFFSSETGKHRTFIFRM